MMGEGQPDAPAPIASRPANRERRPNERPTLAGPLRPPAEDSQPASETGTQSPDDVPPRDPVFVVRANGEILFSNSRLGPHSEDEVVGTSLYDWVPPEQHELVAAALGQVFATAQVQRFEMAGLQHHAPEAWYDCRLTPNLRDGSVVSVTLVAHDITEYKETTLQLDSACRDLRRLLEERTADLERAQATIAAETQTREDREREWFRFRALMDHAGEAIFVTDPRTEQLIDLNETAARWIGRSRDDAIGRRLHELRIEFPVIPPVEVELEFTETRDTRRPLFLSGAHRRRDGSTFPVEVAVATHTVGEQRYVLAVARDVKGRSGFEQELSESRERYRMLFEQSWDAIYLTARDGEIEDVNGAAVELFGYARSEFLGMDGRQLFADPVDIRRFQVQMSTLGSVGDLEVQLVTKDGGRFTALLSATRRPAHDGTIKGYQCIARPLTLPEEGTSLEPDEDAEAAESVSTGVLLAGSGRTLRDAEEALTAADMGVLRMESLAEAADVARSGQHGFTCAVLDGDAQDLREQLEVIRAGLPDTALFLVTRGDPVRVAEQVADLGIKGILRKPVHPLALLQKLREH
jgi:PAS domain S-box-containing protein